MQYAFGRGRKHRTAPKFDAKDPRGIAICDGCGFLVQHSHLREKKDYRGGSVPVGLGIYVCASCDDVPQPYYLCGKYRVTTQTILVFRENFHVTI